MNAMEVSATDATKPALTNLQHLTQAIFIISALGAVVLAFLLVSLSQSLAVMRNDRFQLARLTEDIGEISQEKLELLQSNNLLTNLASTDALTGLSNRAGGDAALSRYFDAATRMHSGLSVLMIDVDQFKEYNDNFGHPAGDQVLRQISQILKDTLRTDDQAVRFGGEEFLVVLPFCDEQVAIDVAERIRVLIRDVKWQYRPVTVSIGASTLQNTTSSADQLVGEADQALYMSKNIGRNRTTHFKAVRMMVMQLQENQNENLD